MTGFNPQFVPALVEPARIVNVNIRDWTVDTITEHGERRDFDIQVSSLYLHYMNGEGVYVMPEVGAYVWLCRPSTGARAAPFILGFHSLFEESEKNFRSNRPQLNPGDIMLKTRDENFLVLRRGGVVQIGATPMAQRMYLPIGNYIHDFCSSYIMDSLSGSMSWIVKGEEYDKKGENPTKFSLLVKQKANDPGHIVEVTAGSHGDKDPTTLVVTVKESGKTDAKTKVTLTITNEGNVSWNIEKDLSLVVKGNMTETVEKDYSISVNGAFSEVSKMDGIVESKKSMTLKGGTTALVQASSAVNLEAAQIKLGGDSATHPLVYGDKLVTWLGDLINVLVTSTPPIKAGPLGADLPGMVSQKSKTA